MADINVENVSWNAEAVATYPTEKEFVDTYISDPGTYPLLPDNKAREKALKLVYSIAVPKKPKDSK